jgi:membrane-associated phospholipid phosphatase
VAALIEGFRSETDMAMRGPLAVDYLTQAYLAATAVVALTSLSGVGLLITALHVGAMVLIAWAAALPLPKHGLAVFFRLFYPVALTPILYLELAPLNQLHVSGYFDAAVMHWEELVFGSQLAMVFSERIGHLWFSEMLHIGYFSYYFIVPGAAATAFLLKGPRALERASFTIALAFFMCYLCFSVFPVAGPRYDFPTIAGDGPSGPTFGLVHTILESGSSKGTAFPSSHVAATMSAWFATGRESKRVFWIMAPFAVSLTLGTVYGRFHYGIDATVGLVVAISAYLATPWLMHRLEGGDQES